MLPDATFSYVSDLILGCQNVKDADEVANVRIVAEFCDADMAAAQISLVGIEEHAVSTTWDAMYDLWATKYESCNINAFRWKVETFIASSLGSLLGGKSSYTLTNLARIPSATKVFRSSSALACQARTNCLHWQRFQCATRGAYQD